MLNYLRPTELTRDEFIRLVECYERLGVTETTFCRDGEMSFLTRTEIGWTARKGDVLKILKRTKRGWRFSSHVSNESSIEPLLQAAA